MERLNGPLSDRMNDHLMDQLALGLGQRSAQAAMARVEQHPVD
jgi:hypothetical protein